MEWREDPETWEKLNRLTEKVWPPLNDFLVHVSKYPIDPIASTFLFGILGKFVASHRQAIESGSNDQESLARSIDAIMQDPRFNALAQNSINSKIDEVVGNVAES